MNSKTRRTMRDEVVKRADHVAKIGDVLVLADKAARHYTQDRPTRAEVQAMIDETVASPRRILMGMFRHLFRVVTGQRKRLEVKLRADELALQKADDDAIDELRPKAAEG